MGWLISLHPLTLSPLPVCLISVPVRVSSSVMSRPDVCLAFHVYFTLTGFWPRPRLIPFVCLPVYRQASRWFVRSGPLACGSPAVNWATFSENPLRLSGNLNDCSWCLAPITFNYNSSCYVIELWKSDHMRGGSGALVRSLGGKNMPALRLWFLGLIQILTPIMWLTPSWREEELRRPLLCFSVATRLWYKISRKRKEMTKWR